MRERTKKEELYCRAHFDLRSFYVDPASPIDPVRAPFAE